MNKKSEVKTDALKTVNLEATKEINPLDALKDELTKMREELKSLRAAKTEFSDAEKQAVEDARELMLTDDDIGCLYIDPKYLDEDNYNYTIADSSRAGRIEKRLKQGYEVVYSEDMKVGSQTVSNSSRLTDAVTVQLGGENGQKLGILMRIPKDLYNRRQKAKALRTKETDAAMLSNMLNKSDFGSIEIGSDSYKK